MRENVYLIDKLPCVLPLGYSFFEKTVVIVDARAGIFQTTDLKEKGPQYEEGYQF